MTASITFGFYCAAVLDLIIYYIALEFPEKKFFLKKRMSLLTTLWRVMWILVLFSLFIGIYYIFMSLLWFILGAMVNPNAYLVYASGALAFITVVSQKVTVMTAEVKNVIAGATLILSNKRQQQVNELVGK